MKPKTMILMVVAVGCGLGASYMTSKLLADRNKAPAQVPTVPVLVAKARVPAQQVIKDPEKFFEIKQYPQDLAPKKSLGDFAEVKDQRFKNFIEEGKAVGQDDLVNKDQSGLAEKLMPGQRATAIKVNQETLVAGFIHPGSRVDVICTLRGTDQSSKLILQNMLVMAVDQADVRNSEQKTILGQTVTLATSQEEAMRLALAGSLGELRLTLRTPGDTDLINTLSVRASDLDKPIRAGKIEDPVDPSPSSAKGKTEKPDAPILPPVPKEDAKDDEKPEVGPAPMKDEPKAVEPPKPAEEPKEEVKPLKRDADRVVAAPPKPKTKRHTMTIIEGSSVRKQSFVLNGKKEDEEDDEAEGGSDPAPARKEDTRPKPQPKPEQPKTNPAPATSGGPSTKTGRIRTGK